MFCSKCGTKMDEGAKFCIKCGTPVNAVENVEPQNQAVTDTSETLFGVDPARYDMPNQNVEVSSNEITTQSTVTSNGTSNQNTNGGYVPDGSIRKAIKRDARTRPKGSLIICVLIAYLSMFAVTFILNTTVGTVVNDYIELPAWAMIIEYVVSVGFSIVIGFGLVDGAFSIARGSQASLKDLFVKPFYKIGNIVLMYLLLFAIMIAFILLLFIPIVNFVIPLLMMIVMIYLYPVFDVFMMMLMDEKWEKHSFTQTLKSSYELVKGRRVEYYGMVFSFFGWFILGIFTLGILYIWLIPYLRLSLVNMYRRWTGEASFSVSDSGMSNGAVIGVAVGGYCGCLVILVVAVIALLSAGIIANAGIRSYFEHTDSHVESYNNGIDDSLTKSSKEATLKSGDLKVTFKVPSGYQAEDYNSNYIQTFTKEGSENTESITYKLNYIYGDYYQKEIDLIKSIYNTERYTYTDQEFTVKISGKDVQCYSFQAETEYYTHSETYAFYPLNDKYNAFVTIKNADVTKDNISKYIMVK